MQDTYVAKSYTWWIFPPECFSSFNSNLEITCLSLLPCLNLFPLYFSIEVSGFQVGEAALFILLSMVSAHSDLDDAGEIVTPTPRVKRILSSPRCLPHIAQVNFEAVLNELRRFFLIH